MSVLDIACGEGYGTKILSKRAKHTIGSDIDRESIKKAISLHKDANLEFSVEDALKTSFKDGRFDLIASMETIEHIEDGESYLNEMKRILKEDGCFIFSTPQSSIGSVPMNSQHMREYSLLEIQGLASKYFKIEKSVGIKQGRISFPEDPVGTNTMLICRKIK